MIAVLVIPLAVGGLFAITLTLETVERRVVRSAILIAFALRLVLHLLVMRSVAFFSHGIAGGDCNVYERWGSMIAQLWRFGHVHFVTEHEMPAISTAILPCNMLAVLEYLNGSPAPLAGTAISAFLACWTVVIIYRFVRECGAEVQAARVTSFLVLFGPSFLYHTSDVYKDGINAFLVIASLVNAIRLATRFSVRPLVYLAMSLTCLWYVRHYMVFMCLMPLGLGFVGVGRASAPRRIAAAAFMIVIGALLLYSGASDRALDVASATYSHATDAGVLRYNALAWRSHEAAGSGVFVTSYWQALLYTIFAPFPWQFGSFGLQLGKIEALILYWFLYTIYKNRRALWAEHRAVVIMLCTFIIPGTLAYASTMSNVGLIVRQRMPIVIATAILAGLAYRARTSRTHQTHVAGPAEQAT
jgi:hypothetical protein